MLVNASNLGNLFIAFKTLYNEGVGMAPPVWPTLAMRVTSQAREEHYGWMAQLPFFREWAGDRVVKSLALHGYTIKNRKFELTIGIRREDIEDDNLGVFTPMFKEFGRLASGHPEELIFDLLKVGDTTVCYDGQYFFDDDHPVKNAAGQEVGVSNIQPGGEPPWFLLDGSRALKPVIFQERVGYNLQRLDKETDENVFMTDEYLYGVRARLNAGFGLWQFAFMSRDTLDPTNYEAARVAMMNIVGDEGRKLGLRPTHLVHGPGNEAAARTLLLSETLAGGESNPWKGTAIPVLTTQLD